MQLTMKHTEFLNQSQGNRKKKDNKEYNNNSLQIKSQGMSLIL